MDTQWLKAAQENFREAMDRKDWDMAKAVMIDVGEKGFTGVSETMEKELWGKAPRNLHGYILGFLKKKNEEYKAKGLVPTLDMLIEELS